MKQKMPWKRLRNYLGMAAMTVLLSVFFVYRNGWMADRLLAYLLLDAVFFAVVLYMLESGRVRLEIENSESVQYGRIAGYYAAFCLVTAGLYFFPAFTCPAAAFALFLGVAANLETAVTLSVFLCILLCAAIGGSFYELAACCVLAAVGAQMAKTMHEKKNRLWCGIILLSVSMSVPALFYYLEHGKAGMWLLVWNAEFGILTVILYGMLANRLYDRTDYGMQYAYEAIVKENYPLVSAIRSYSRDEYVHALRVSSVAGRCAKEIHADPFVSAAAGFYYRLGILEGEPVIENAVRLAEESCFPEAVIKILSEYNGEERLPSSKESAIVHMVDICVKKIETLNSQKMTSSFSQEMVIYQTLNEASATGIYDESGVSMNQFLKIRELLVHGEIGYDGNDGRGSDAAV